MAVVKYQHYLQRAHERLTERQEQRALALLFDCRLVRYIVAHVPLDARVDRIAIALDDGAAPPCAIVTLDGHAITCLASGMRLGWAQLVYRWLVDKLIADYFASGRRGGAARVLPSSTCPAITPNRTAVRASDTP
jgi:hypothetical protein